jgi:hypothetical protein
MKQLLMLGVLCLSITLHSADTKSTTLPKRQLTAHELDSCNDLLNNPEFCHYVLLYQKIRGEFHRYDLPLCNTNDIAKHMFMKDVQISDVPAVFEIALDYFFLEQRPQGSFSRRALLDQDYLPKAISVFTNKPYYFSGIGSKNGFSKEYFRPSFVHLARKAQIQLNTASNKILAQDNAQRAASSSSLSSRKE